MPNYPNLNAESQADMIGDDAQPTLRLRNTSTGSGLHAEGLAVTSGASIDTLAMTGNIGGAILAASATVSRLNIAGASRASVPILSLKADAFVSCVSIVFAASANWAGVGAIRVSRTDGTFCWIPLLPDATVTAAAI